MIIIWLGSGFSMGVTGLLDIDTHTHIFTKKKQNYKNITQKKRKRQNRAKAREREKERDEGKTSHWLSMMIAETERKKGREKES